MSYHKHSIPTPFQIHYRARIYSTLTFLLLSSSILSTSILSTSSSTSSSSTTSLHLPRSLIIVAPPPLGLLHPPLSLITTHSSTLSRSSSGSKTPTHSTSSASTSGNRQYSLSLSLSLTSITTGGGGGGNLGRGHGLAILTGLAGGSGMNVSSTSRTLLRFVR